MIYEANDPGAPRGILYDGDTGEQLSLVFRFDDDTGDYWYYVTDAQGRVQVDPANPDEILQAHGQRRRLKFVSFDENGEAPFAADEPERKIRFREFL